MPVMRGLTVIVTSGDADRLYSALLIASGVAAQGGAARVFCDGPAVPLLIPLTTAPLDAKRALHGQPRLSELRIEARDLGVRLIACQAGMALAGLEIEALGDGVEAGGLVGLMGDIGDDRLVTL